MNFVMLNNNKGKKKALVVLIVFIVACAVLFLISVTSKICSGSGNADEQNFPPEAFLNNAAEISDEDEIKAKYEKLYDSSITLIIGGSKETIGTNKIMEWYPPENQTDDDKKGALKSDKQAIKSYVHDLAEKYNTFADEYSFRTSSGKNIRIPNKECGWILDEEYAFNEIVYFLESGKKVEIDITDNSDYSNKWWIRIAGDYNKSKCNAESYAEVSIEKQHMWMYIDGRKVLESPVITGNPNTGHSTPTGAFLITGKKENAELSGSDYTANVDYWAEFTYQVGFHDAKWQDSFGGNAYLKRGSLGCVNLPTDVAEKVYKNAFIGMPVFVY